MPKKVIIIGGVGTGTVIGSTIEDIMQESQEWELLGFLNDNMKIGEELYGFPVLGKVMRLDNSTPKIVTSCMH